MKTADQIWQKFVALPGAVVDNQVGIASQQAIEGLIQILQRYKSRKILELGAGIGTLTYTVLETVSSYDFYKEGNFVFFTVENNAFCLEQLANNLHGLEKNFIITSSTNNIPADTQFDLIIVDGGGDLDGDMGVMNFSKMLASKGIIFIEGSRSFQRNLVIDWYGHRKHLYAKMPAINIKTIAGNSGLVVANKPYQVFLFEPSLLDKIRQTTLSAVLTGWNKVIRKLDRNRAQ